MCFISNHSFGWGSFASICHEGDSCRNTGCTNQIPKRFASVALGEELVIEHHKPESCTTDVAAQI